MVPFLARGTGWDARTGRVAPAVYPPRMDVDPPPQAEEFRVRVKAFLGEHLPPGWSGMGGLPEGERERFRAQWRRTLGEHQMLAVSWPQEYGGAGLSLVEQVVLAEEFALAGAPQGSENDSFGIGMLGNTLIALGTEEQKRHYLPKILSGEQRWCQGYSEPDAGSDLAGIRTCKATRSRRRSAGIPSVPGERIHPGTKICIVYVGEATHRTPVTDGQGAEGRVRICCLVPRYPTKAHKHAAFIPPMSPGN